MRESARFAVTLTALALFAGGLGAVALVDAVKETGRVVSFGLKHSYQPPVATRVNRAAKGDREALAPTAVFPSREAERKQYMGPHFGWDLSRII